MASTERDCEASSVSACIDTAAPQHASLTTQQSTRIARELRKSVSSTDERQMPQALRCPCGNLSFSLASAPSPVPRPPSFPSSIKKFGCAELTVAGANWVWDVLVETKVVSPEWRLITCLNCRTDCYAQRIGTQELLVNAELHSRDEQPGSEGGLHWCPALGVAVENNPDVSNSLLEAPEVMDDSAVQLFQALQRVVESHVGAHTAAVHERIRAFEEEQREALSVYTMNAYRDRKVLWHNIVQALARRHTPAQPTPLPPSLGAATSATGADVAEWLRASTSAVQPSAVLKDSESPRMVRANQTQPPPTSPLVPPSTSPAAAPSIAPPPRATTPQRGPITNAFVPASNNAPISATAPSPSPMLAPSQHRAASPRPRAAPILPQPPPTATVPAMVAASLPTMSALHLHPREPDVFRLEEEEGAVHDRFEGAGVEDDAETSSEGQGESALPPLRSRHAYRELPPVAPSADMLFGTSVPISIPPPRSLAAASSTTTTTSASVTGAANNGEAVDPAFDVPLSSTRRMKGYL